MRRMKRRINSGFLHKLFPALGTGDGDFSLPLGHTNTLAALGAGKILVLPILDLLDHKQKSSVFPIPLVGIAGEAAEQCGNQAGIGNQNHNAFPPAQRQKCGNQADDDTRPQNHRV